MLNASDNHGEGGARILQRASAMPHRPVYKNYLKNPAKPCLILPAVVALTITVCGALPAAAGIVSTASGGNTKLGFARRLAHQLVCWQFRAVKQAAIFSMHAPLILFDGVMNTADVILFDMSQHIDKARFHGFWIDQDGLDTKPILEKRVEA